MKHIIIGAGVAGVTAAKTIRKIDKDAEVVLIGNEQHFPYKRFLLTEFLCGSVNKEDVVYFKADSLDKLGIKLRKGSHVKTIMPSENSIKLFHNEVLRYDKLLIATGGCPGLGTMLRPFKKHIQRYYSLNDILVLKQKLADVKKCIVFGEGISSLDLICGLSNLGKQVTYIFKGERADFALKESELYGELNDFLEEKGVEIIPEDQVVSIEKINNHYRVQTLKQRELETDIVFAWDNYKPSLGCIKGTNIKKKHGVIVNDQMETSVQNIYAAGDCVEIYHPCIKDYWINFGSPNAIEQGEIAGKNMVGQKEVYKIHDAIVFNIMGKSLKARWWK